MKEALWIGLGGCAGALTRYWLASAIGARVATPFPLGTLVINLTGSFLLGLLVGLLDGRIASPIIRLALATGFLGAYTTFSTFTFETIRLLEEGSLLLASLNVVGSVVLGLGAVLGGLLLGRLL